MLLLCFSRQDLLGEDETEDKLIDLMVNFQLNLWKHLYLAFTKRKKVFFHMKGLSNLLSVLYFKGKLYSHLVQLPNVDLSRAPFSTVDVLKSLLMLRSNHPLKHVRHYHLFFKNQS